MKLKHISRSLSAFYLPLRVLFKTNLSSCSHLFACSKSLLGAPQSLSRAVAAEAPPDCWEDLFLSNIVWYLESGNRNKCWNKQNQQKPFPQYSQLCIKQKSTLHPPKKIACFNTSLRCVKPCVQIFALAEHPCVPAPHLCSSINSMFSRGNIQFFMSLSSISVRCSDTTTR